MRGQDKLRTIPVVLTSQHAEAGYTGRYLIGHGCGEICLPMLFCEKCVVIILHVALPCHFLVAVFLSLIIASIFSKAQLINALMCGSNDLPLSVRTYSTRGGTSGNIVRVT